MWVFGSAAKGYATPDSELDLLVVMDGPIDLIRDYNRLSRVAHSLGIDCPINLLLNTKARFEERREWIGFVQREAAIHGVRFKAS